MQSHFTNRAFVLSAGAMALMLTLCGCSSEPTFGDRLLQEGDAQRLLGEQWNEGQTLIKKGNKQIQRGSDKIHKGNQLIADGQTELAEGKDAVQRGQLLINQVEKTRGVGAAPPTPQQ